MHLDKNTIQPLDISPHTAAMVAGLGLLAMAILAPFANFYVLQNLIVSQDASATVAHILASSGLFRIGIATLLLVAVLDIMVAWALYVLLEPVRKSLSLLAAWLRVAYAALFIVSLNPLLRVLQLLEGNTYLHIFEKKQLDAQVMLSIGEFRSAWDMSLVVFGFHLLVLGYVVFKSGYLPKWLGALVGIAGTGYLVDGFGKLLIANYTMNIGMFTFVGEVILIFWLLGLGIRGFGQKSSAFSFGK